MPHRKQKPGQLVAERQVSREGKSMYHSPSIHVPVLGNGSTHSFPRVNKRFIARGHSCRKSQDTILKVKNKCRSYILLARTLEAQGFR